MINLIRVVSFKAKLDLSIWSETKMGALLSVLSTSAAFPEVGIGKINPRTTATVTNRFFTRFSLRALGEVSK
jgi:hypothetical protein